MGGRLHTLAILLLIALRNLAASRLKTCIVGGIIFFGAALVVVGSSLLDSVDVNMRQSIVGSIAGHLQVYSSESRDELALYGGMMGEAQLEPMTEFAAVKKVALSVPNVRAIVPMGSAEAMVASGNELDLALEKLRGISRDRLSGSGTEQQESFDSLKAHVRKMVGLLRRDYSNAAAMVDEKAAADQANDLSALDRATSDEFWGGFAADPLAGLEFLENQVAPLGLDGDMLWIRYVGTDLGSFSRAFDRMEIVEGTAVPKGQRGILLGKLYMEDYTKLKTARRLDRMRDALRDGGKQIKGDEELERFVRENIAQVRDITMQLDPAKEKLAIARLQKELGSQKAELGELLTELLQTDDQNFEQRYQIFYGQLAPLLQLYKVKVGDTLTIKAASRSGYFKSINVKVYGVYSFKGLEKAGFAGLLSLMDLMSFRDLYGYMTADKVDEIKQLQQGAGTKAVAREDAEEALFGSSDALVGEAARTEGFDESKMLDQIDAAALAGELANRSYSQEEIDSGVALHSAVILEDPSKALETQAALQKAVDAAGLKLRVVDWQKASGMIGQFIALSRGVLYIAVLIIFLVALVIINNAMVMATLQRVKEIGTMRAVGAQKRFILTMLVIEALAVGLLFGLAGAGVGAGIIGWLGHVGIPATREELYFFFSGPRLFPSLGGASVAVSFAIVLLVSVLSSLYPARLAMRITPLQAMQSSEE